MSIYKTVCVLCDGCYVKNHFCCGLVNNSVMWEITYQIVVKTVLTITFIKCFVVNLEMSVVMFNRFESFRIVSFRIVSVLIELCNIFPKTCFKSFLIFLNVFTKILFPFHTDSCVHFISFHTISYFFIWFLIPRKTI